MRVAISCAGADERIAFGIRDRLTERGLPPSRIFYSNAPDPRSKLGARLRQQYTDADILILVISDAYVASPWCAWELLVASARIVHDGSDDVHMLLIDRAEMPDQLKATQAYHGFTPQKATSKNWAKAVDDIASRIIKVAIPQPTAGRNNHCQELIERHLKGLRVSRKNQVTLEVVNSAATLLGLSQQQVRAADLSTALRTFEAATTSMVNVRALSSPARAQLRAEVRIAAKTLVAWAQGRREGDSKRPDDALLFEHLAAYLVRHLGHRPLITVFLDNLRAVLFEVPSKAHKFEPDLYVSARQVRKLIGEHFWSAPPGRTEEIKPPVSVKVLSTFRKSKASLLTRDERGRRP